MTRAAIKHGEERLRAAMLASDVPTLDALLDDAFLFVTPDGSIVRKEDDLERHRVQTLTKLEPRDLVVELHGEDVGIATVLVDLAGVTNTQPFAGLYRYTRTWRRTDEGVWRVIAGAVIRAQS